MHGRPPDLRKLAQLFQAGAELLSSLGQFARTVAPGLSEADDPYRILGVQPGDRPEMIRAVYRTKSKVLHPDTKITGDAEAFKKLQWAYAQFQQQGRTTA